jgi:hypothetical protein
VCKDELGDGSPYGWPCSPHQPYTRPVSAPLCGKQSEWRCSGSRRSDATSGRSRCSHGEASTLCSIVGSENPDASGVGAAFKLRNAKRRSTNTKHQKPVQTRSTKGPVQAQLVPSVGRFWGLGAREPLRRSPFVISFQHQPRGVGCLRGACLASRLPKRERSPASWKKLALRSVGSKLSSLDVTNCYNCRSAVGTPAYT